jgi:hypothetical protein
MSRKIYGVVAAGAVMLFGAPSAIAATTIGQTFTPATECGVITFLQSISPNNQYAAPAAGVITSWRFQAASPAPQVKLKVARALGGNDFTIVGESELQTLTANTVNSFSARISVQAGDVLGIFNATEGTPCGIAPATPGFLFHFIEGDVPPGPTTTFNSSGNVTGQFPVAATLEPDCDNDGFGDETQDPQVPPGGPCPGGRNLTLDASKNKVKKGKRVTLSGQLTEIAKQVCQSGQAVELQRKKPSKTTFATFEQVQTDAAGAFSSKEKVKKTFQYRAQVPETATCTGQTSNTEKVKVKKKRK